MAAKKTYIEKSWQSFHRIVFPNATESQLADHRTAFFAGAAILFKGAIGAISDGDEITESDMLFMSTVSDEIDEFGAQLDRDVLGIDLRQPSN